MGERTLDVRSGIVPDANGAVAFHEEGTNFPIAGYEFDTANNEELYFSFPVRNWDGTGDFTISLSWYNNGTDTANDAIFGASISAITPNTDTQDIETDGLDTEDTFTDTHLGTTAQRVHEASWAIDNANLDAAADDDMIQLRLRVLSTSTIDGPVRVFGEITLSWADA